MFWKPTVPVLGDVGTFMKDLSSSVHNYSCDKEWISTLRQRDQVKEEANLKVSNDDICIFPPLLKILFIIFLVLISFCLLPCSSILQSNFILVAKIVLLLN